MGSPQPREDAMRRIYHTVHFEVHDEKALHEFVRKHADPEEFSAMEKLDASQAEGEPPDHVFSDISTFRRRPCTDANSLARASLTSMSASRSESCESA